MTTLDLKTSFFLWKRVDLGGEDASEDWQEELWHSTLGSPTMRSH